MASRKRGVKITDPEVALFEIRAGHQMFSGSHCHPAGKFKSWTIGMLLGAVERGTLYTSEPVVMP